MSSDAPEELREALLDLERAHARERQTRLEAEALLAGLRGLSEDHGEDRMFARLLEVLRGLIGFDDAVIVIAQDGGLRRVAATSSRFDEVRWEPASLLERLSLRRPRALFDVTFAPEWRDQPSSVTSGVSAALHVLLTEHPWPAILVCTHASRGYFGETQARLATRFAALASQALASYAYVRQLEQLNVQLAAEIGERRRAEALAATRQAQVLHTAKMAALGEMAGGVAHEINTPLAIIGTATDQLREHLGDPALLDHNLALIERTTQRIARIVRGLRSFSRDGSADPPVATPVKALVDDTLELCRERLRSASVRLDIAEIPRGLQVICRPAQLVQVLLNLVGNGVDAVQGAPDPWLRIEVQAADRVELAVCDSGPGVSAAVRERLFQPFFTTKPAGKGVGLGLSISRGLVEAQGGELVLDDSCPHTRFVVSLARGVDGGV